jgi:hypothetical protein
MDLTSASAIVTAVPEASAERPCAGSPRTGCTGLSPRQRSRSVPRGGRAPREGSGSARTCTRGYPVRQQSQPATMVAASAIRWSFVQGGPSVARGPCRTSSARSPSMLVA